MRKYQMLAVSALAVLAVSACTTEQEQTVLNDIQATCIALPVGTAIAIEVASSIGGAGATAATISQVVQAAGNTVCTTLIAGVQALITKINDQGGTATVTVNTSNPVSGFRSTRRMVFAPNAAPKIYVVPPSPY
jgi:hypothetical protein